MQNYPGPRFLFPQNQWQGGIEPPGQDGREGQGAGGAQYLSSRQWQHQNLLSFNQNMYPSAVPGSGQGLQNTVKRTIKVKRRKHINSVNSDPSLQMRNGPFMQNNSNQSDGIPQHNIQVWKDSHRLKSGLLVSNNDGFFQNNNSAIMQSNHNATFMQSINGGSFMQNNSGGSFSQNNNGGSFLENNNGGSIMQINNGESIMQNNNGGSFMQNNNGGSFMQNNNGGSFI